MKRTAAFTCILSALLFSFFLFGAAILLSTVPESRQTALQTKISSTGMQQDNQSLHMYSMKEESGVVGVYLGSSLLYTTDIPFDLLPQNDRQALKEGIFVSSQQEIQQLLEDFGA